MQQEVKHKYTPIHYTKIIRKNITSNKIIKKYIENRIIKRRKMASIELKMHTTIVVVLFY